MTSHVRSTRAIDDFVVRAAIIWSYRRTVNPITWAFILARTATLPLSRFHDVLAAEGDLVEIGCGHGIVTQYLARRGRDRTIAGYDPDHSRIGVAREAAAGLANLYYVDSPYLPGGHKNLNAVVIVGVLCLVDDAACVQILSAAHASLAPGGVLLLSDILKNDRDWRFAFHIWRERWFARVRFTKGAGLFVRSPEQWEQLVLGAGFRRIEPFNAPVPLHSVFNWICR